MSPREAKAHDLINMPAPTTKQQLRAFIGLSNYFQLYVPHFSKFIFPLTELLKKNVHFVCYQMLTEAILQLKLYCFKNLYCI